MLLEKAVPRRLWPEAVQYIVYIMNRSPSRTLAYVTPEEKWNNYKPVVDHLRIFRSIAYALMPYQRRIKLDERSVKSVLFGVSKDLKAYQLYNLETKKIIVSRDVFVNECKSWDWEEEKQENELIWDKTETVEGETRGNVHDE